VKKTHKYFSEKFLYSVSSVGIVACFVAIYKFASQGDGFGALLIAIGLFGFSTALAIAVFESKHMSGKGKE